MKLDEDLRIFYNRKMAASEQKKKVLNELIMEEVKLLPKNFQFFLIR